MISRTFLTISLLASALAISPSPVWAKDQKKVSPAELLKRLQEAGDEPQEEEAFVWPEDLPKDLPLYPGIKHEPLKLMEGYYRFNIQAPTSDRAAIIETFREQGKEKGWTVKADKKESEVTHHFHFTKEGGNLIIKVTSDGVDTKAVYFEFMTDEFIEKVQKRRQ